MIGVIKMKFLLISNSTLAEEMYEAMKNFYTNPEIDFIHLASLSTNDFIKKIKNYLLSTSEEFLILCDLYGSTAFNETAYLLQELKLLHRSVIITGMSLPMTFKLYGLKDQWNICSIKSLYQTPDSKNHGIFIYDKEVAI